MPENKIRNELDGLVETTIKMNAETAHVISSGYKQHPEVTTVTSVYNGVKPSHVVLEELYEWAKEFNPIVVKKIDELTAAT
ncbi:hypothetical protein EVJ32_10760 [Exiguobacterium sp. SH5S4]|uniref:hypothetical protein n=1 Tax=Exiguobacterium sp. SH5S4 TaxID=2510961 RepID=UPI00103CD4FC|nr:hypothetical protein [Exiguobacterium sp. SH5S4]TCI25273.1 hypothetical protein EVJ32_10760 [Exiguobacterium sp. SH5S4]